MKRIVSSTHVLTTPDFSKPFVIECDTSGYGLGEVLMQDEHLIDFESTKWNNREQLMSTYDKEMLAIVQALVKWWQ